MPRPKRRHTHLPTRLRLSHGAYYHVRTVAGKQYWQRLSRDYATALRKWAEIEGAADPERTIQAALSQSLAAATENLSPKTVQQYRTALGRLCPVFGSMRPEDLTPPDVNRYLRESQTPTQANRDVAFLSRTYTQMNAWGWVNQYNPCRKIGRNTEVERDRYVTDTEMAHITRLAGPQMRCMLAFAYLTGARKSAMLQVRQSDVTDEGVLILKPGKKGRKLLVEWTPALRAVIEEIGRLSRPVGSLYLFCNRRGQPYTTSGFDSLWRRVKLKAERRGISDVRWHDMRRKAGSDMPLESAFALLGHRDIRTTVKHYRAGPERVKPVK